MQQTRNSKLEAMQYRFLQSLPYDDLREAKRLIHRGGDYALLYFWFNLKELHYHPNFSISMVMKEVTYYIEKYPTFEEDIVEWFKRYEQRIKNLKS